MLTTHNLTTAIQDLHDKEMEKIKIETSEEIRALEDFRVLLVCMSIILVPILFLL